MAPEQLEGKDVDARTDIFAFGAVVYERVTGRRAFEGKSQVSLIASIMEHEPQSMSSLQATTPPSLDRLVRTCLAKDPYDRWQTAVDLKRELRWASQTEPTVSAERPSGAAWAKTLPVALGALIVGVLIAVMVTRIPLQPVEVTRTSVNVFPGTRLTGGVELETTVGFQRPSRQSLVFSPDGRHLIYAATDGEDTQLYLRQMDQAEGAPIRGTEGGSQPFFSSDGQFVGFFVGRDLMRVPIEGGEARTITSRGFVNWGASWTDEDTILLGGTDGVSQISANGGTLEQLTTVDPSRGEFGYFYPELLPGGQAVLFNVAGIDGIPGEWDIFVQSLESGERQLLVEGGSDPRYLASGHIAFARAGTLMAVPFDARLLEVTAPPIVVIEDLMHGDRGVNSDLNLGAAQFSVSNSGSLAYVSGGVYPGAERSLLWVGRNGDAEPVPLPAANYLNPRFSPDGTRLAYGVGVTPVGQIWVYDIALEVPVPLTSQGNNAWSVWSPDGTRIAFASDMATGGPRNLFWMAADGCGEPERLTESDQAQSPSSWSQAGVLAFLEGEDIWTLSMDGESAPERFLETPFNEQHATFSPDGNWLAYTSNETGGDEVYVRPFPAAEPAYRVSIDGGASPLWARDGRELFYQTPREERNRRIMVVDVITGSTFTRSQPRLLLEGSYRGTTPVRSYDISPDGQQIVMITGTGQQPELQPVTSIDIILNWFEELKERVPVP